MKKNKVLAAVFALLFVCIVSFGTSNAAENTIYLNAVKSETGIVSVACEADAIGAVTDGKIRIYYNADKLVLEKTAVGNAMTGFSYVINDPISGNKDEGEIVFVFAAAEAIEMDGSMLDMTFSVKDGVELTADDFSLTAEKMMSGTTDVLASGVTVQEATYTDETASSEGTGTEAGTGTGTGSGESAGEAAVTSSAINIADVTIEAIDDQTYTGKKVRPGVTMVYGGKTLVEGQDYYLSYKNNKKIGKATVKIYGKGEYTGTETRYFYIAPKAPKLKSFQISKSSKKATVKWKRRNSADGYQIEIATDKNFTKSVKTVTIKKNSSKKTITKNVKLSSVKKGKYYVRMRSYKTIDGERHYGKYSAKKRVKVK